MAPMIAIFVVEQGLIFLILFWYFHQQHRK